MTSCALMCSRISQRIHTLAHITRVRGPECPNQLSCSENFASNWTHPYNLTLHQFLELGDPENRRDLVNMILSQVEQDSDFLGDILWTDKTSFSRNSEMLSILYTSDVTEIHTHSKKSYHHHHWCFSVWWGVHYSKSFGNYYSTIHWSANHKGLLKTSAVTCRWVGLARCGISITEL